MRERPNAERTEDPYSYVYGMNTYLLKYVKFFKAVKKSTPYGAPRAYCSA